MSGPASGMGPSGARTADTRAGTAVRRAKGALRQLAPRSLRGQILLVIVGALVLAQTVALWLFSDERDLAVRAALTREALGRVANVASLLERVPPVMRPAVLRAASSPLVRFRLSPRPAVQAHGHAPPAIMAQLREAFEDLSGEGAGKPREVRLDLHAVRGVMPPMPGLPERMRGRHREMAMSAVEMRLAARLSDGLWLNVLTRFHRPPLQWAWADVATFALTAIVLLAAVWLALGRIVGPLGHLADAADRLGRGEWVDEIAPSGPEELARLTVAFNRMQARLRRFVDERGRMLAALGHDLRSPLTALRVRAEMVDDAEARAALIASIDEMQHLVEVTLAYARGTALTEPVEDIDAARFLGDLVADYRATDRDVSLEPPPQDLILRGRPGSLRRALRNLVDNALRYGGAARLSVDSREDEIRINVDDRGPGIPQAELAHVFAPFVRLEGSRSRETGGVGLGLAIARAILRAHGGDVTLENRAEGGLRATLILPCGPDTGADQGTAAPAPDD